MTRKGCVGFYKWKPLDVRDWRTLFAVLSVSMKHCYVGFLIGVYHVLEWVHFTHMRFKVIHFMHMRLKVIHIHG